MTTAPAQPTDRPPPIGVGIQALTALCAALVERGIPASQALRAMVRALLDPDTEDPTLEPAQRAMLRRLAGGPTLAIDPVLLGFAFLEALDPAERHRRGAHYTHEDDIRSVIGPTILVPWRQHIAAAETREELLDLERALRAYRVLDPACGGGAFLCVALTALGQLQQELRRAIETRHPCAARPSGPTDAVDVDQCLGIDLRPEAVEVTRLCLVLTRLRIEGARPPLARGTLDRTIRTGDALFMDWPRADAIIGNPPFVDARKLTQEWGPDYSARLRARYAAVPGRADYCVYFFRRAHDALAPGGRAGLVGTNTVRQNYSREGGLDHIVATGGTITDAVATQRWPGDAAVHVSIVNWRRGPSPGPKPLRWQDEAGAWHEVALDHIPSSLSHRLDVSQARPLAANREPKRNFEGIQPGHEGFTLDAAQRDDLLRAAPAEAAVLRGYLNGADLLTGAWQARPRWLIDLGAMDLFEARAHPAVFAHLQRTVLPDWQANAAQERARTGRDRGEHQRRLQTWWQLKRRRGDMLEALATLPRYIACARVTKRPIFAFLDRTIFPDSALSVFAFADDYSFGVLQSGFHWAWFTARCSTHEERFRYTSTTVWDSFPWPQAPGLAQVRAVAKAAVALRAARERIQEGLGLDLRALYRRAERPGANLLADAQRALDHAVADAYGVPPEADPLRVLLDLNQDCAAMEAAGRPVRPPGLPTEVDDPGAFSSADRLTLPPL